MVDHWSVCNVCIYFSLEANTRSWRRGRLLRLHNNQATIALLRAKWFTQMVAPAFIIWGEWPPHNYVIPENLGQNARVFIPKPPLYEGTTILLLPREGAGQLRNTLCRHSRCGPHCESLLPGHQADEERGLQRIPATICPATSRL